MQVLKYRGSPYDFGRSAVHEAAIDKRKYGSIIGFGSLQGKRRTLPCQCDQIVSADVLGSYWDRTTEEDVRPLIFLMSD